MFFQPQYSCDSCKKVVSNSPTPYISIKGSVCMNWMLEGERKWEYISERNEEGVTTPLIFCGADCFGKWVALKVGGQREESMQDEPTAGEQYKCSRCGELGHNKRRHLTSELEVKKGYGY